METVDSIMQNLEDRVVRGDAISPGFWVECALRINQLCSPIEQSLVKIESQILEIEARLIKEDMPAAKAKILARSEVDYSSYLSLKSRLHRIDEFIKLAKRRAAINEY